MKISLLFIVFVFNSYAKTEFFDYKRPREIFSNSQGSSDLDVSVWLPAFIYRKLVFLICNTSRVDGEIRWVKGEANLTDPVEAVNGTESRTTFNITLNNENDAGDFTCVAKTTEGTFLNKTVHIGKKGLKSLTELTRKRCNLMSRSGCGYDYTVRNFCCKFTEHVLEVLCMYGMPNFEYISSVISKNRLSIFTILSRYYMMQFCWDAEPARRPSFEKLEDILVDLLDESVRMHYIELSQPYVQTNDDALSHGETDYLTMTQSRVETSNEEDDNFEETQA